MLDTDDDQCALYDKAVEIVRADEKCSASFIQRKLGIGFNKAARLIERMEDAGIVSAADHVGKREVYSAANPRMRISTTGPDGTVHESPPFSLNQMKSAGERLREADEATNGKSRMKSTPDDEAVKDRAYGIAADELRSFIERWERLDEERQEVVDQQKEVMAEAKGRGYDVKILRHIIKLRKREPDDIAEEEAVLEMYKAALGMS